LSTEALLQRIRVVLVATSHAGNIGACARAMKTMGLKRLVLVDPQSFPDPEATARAVGAEDILEQALVADSLDAALADCQYVIGTSARSRRSIPWPLMSPDEAGKQAVKLAAGSEVALLFGRERTGLTNDELERCQVLVNIPTDPGFSSLNLAAAVQVLAYELRCAALEQAEPSRSAGVADMLGERLATGAELQGFREHLERILVETSFLDPENPRQLMRRVMRLFNRVALTANEVNILRGMLSAMTQNRGKSDP